VVAVAKGRGIAALAIEIAETARTGLSRRLSGQKMQIGCEQGKDKKARE